MNILFYIRTICCFSLFLVFISGFSQSRYIPECDEIIKSDSTEYFVAGLMDHRDLEKEWIKEEIDKNNIKDWIINYIARINLNNDNIDTINLTESRKQDIEFYHKEWQQIENKLLFGDRVFYYSTPEEYWYVEVGQDGLIVVRDCKILYVLILLQS